MEPSEKMTHPQRATLHLFVCFTPTFALNVTDPSQGCWLVVSRQGDALHVSTRGCDNQSFRVESPSTREAAWALAQLIQWQWSHGLRALRDTRAPISVFLSDSEGGTPWATQRRLFERPVHLKELELVLEDVLRLQGLVSVPRLVDA